MIWSPSRVGLALVTAGLLSSCAPSGGDSASDGGDSSDGASSADGGGTDGGDTGDGASSADGGGFVATGPVDFGPNVVIFDPSMSMASIQSQLDQVFGKQQQNQFGAERYAYFFKPGKYALDVQLGFYMTVHGLGSSPDDVTITGAVRSKADWFNGNATQNFWRGAENLAVVPTRDSNVDVWAVSQATWLRRVHVEGSINLWDSAYQNAWSSGGFIADSKIDGTIDSGTQQQFLTRNSALHDWQGGSWNMVFVGDDQPPAGAWPGSPYTVVDRTPSVREKPYLVIDAAGSYSVVVPSLKASTQGITWAAGATAGTTIPINKFYIARAGTDTAATINAALQAGANLIFTPGVYHLSSALAVTRPGTVVLGLGLATLVPEQGNVAMTVADVDGVSIAGVLFDAGAQKSPTLLKLGGAKSGIGHAANPTVLFDVSCRVGGAGAASTASCAIVESNDVLIDEAWLWRADHGNGVGWDTNPAQNGIVVDGDGVGAYGLFVEHFEEYQTLWNGNGGWVYFYQSEIPYDVPSQDRWAHDGENGYASFKVAASASGFDARGLGVYCVFYNPVVLDNAVETPAGGAFQFQHLITVWLGTGPGSAIRHIINGQGGGVQQGTMVARSAN